MSRYTVLERPREARELGRKLVRFWFFLMHPGRGRANAEASEESVGSGSLKTQIKREAGPVWRGNDLPDGPKRIH